LYCGVYEVTGDSAQVVTESLLKREEIFGEVRESELRNPEAQNSATRETTVAASDTTLAEAAQSTGLRVIVVEPIDAGIIARLGFRKVQAGQTVSPEQLEANYIRRTDAEMMAKVSS
jgi:tRNA A37 threonylcarbamoyladenosine modification protein TsaB